MQKLNAAEPHCRHLQNLCLFPFRTVPSVAHRLLLEQAGKVPQGSRMGLEATSSIAPIDQMALTHLRLA